MALSISSELASVQGSVSRQPLIEVIAGRLNADFPFLGNPLPNMDSDPHGVSSSLFLSDGSYAILFAGRTSNYVERELRIQITDPDVTQFSDYISIGSFSSTINEIVSILLPSGNIGVGVRYGTQIDILEVTTEGTIVSTYSFTSLTSVNGLALSQTPSGYILLYSNSDVIYKATSVDFSTWSSASAITIGGLSGNSLQDLAFLQRSDDSYILLFSYATVDNETSTVYDLYYSTSTDLSIWEDAVPITTASVAEDYLQSDIVEREDGSLFISAVEKATYLEINSDSPGWNTEEDIGPSNVWVDSTAGKVYLTTIYYGVGAKKFLGMCRIDIPTWSIDRFYDGNTTPAIPAPLLGVGCYEPYLNRGNGALATVHSSTRNAVALADFDSDTITGYYFDDYSSLGEEFGQNVNCDELKDYFGSSWSSIDILYSEPINGKLWIAFHYQYGGGTYSKIAIGYIDISQVTAPYDFNLVISSQIYTATAADRTIKVYPDSDIAIFAWKNLSNWEGGLITYSLSEGAKITHYDYQTHTDFPFAGVLQCVGLIGDKIWATPYYDQTYSPASDDLKWGLMSIDVVTHAIQYYYPDWITDPGWYFTSMTINESGNEIILHRGDGVAVFNYVNNSWTNLTNGVNPSLPPTDDSPYSAAQDVAYDPITDTFVYGSMNHVYMVPRGGTITTIQYISEDGLMNFNSPVLMVANYDGSNPSLALDGNSTIYCSWTGENEVTWDKENARLNLGKYLIMEDPKPWKKSIREPGSFEFKVSHGNLFDRNNDLSALRGHLQKGLFVTVRQGQRIDGVEYFAPQGTFIITSVGVVYRTKEYPVYRVTCRDKSYLWENNYIPAIRIDNKTAELALTQLLNVNAKQPIENIIIPTMPLSFSFDLQLIDTPLYDILTDLGERFRHWLYVRLDDNVEYRPYDFTADSVNTWDSLISWDDRETNSDLTNWIKVHGKSLTDFMVTYEERPLGQKSGTMGWWGCKNEHIIYYSTDRQLMARDPRLEVIESSTSALFKLAGKVKESISYVDPYNKYVVIKVEAPSLVPMLLAAIGMYAVGNAMGDGLAGFGAGWTIPVGRKIEGVAVLLALNVLGSVANYQFEVHGCPVGYSNRSYSAVSEDEELLTKMGYEVREEFEGLLCHNQGHCQLMADFFRDILVLERKPVQIKKPTDLRDEPGDIVLVRHPDTGVYKKVFIVDIERTHEIPERSNKDSDTGGLIDVVNGWVI